MTVHRHRGQRAVATKLNGKPCKGERATPGGRRVICGTLNAVYHGSSIYVRVRRIAEKGGDEARRRVDVYISLKGGAKASANSGLCGTAKMYPGLAGKGRFPCKGCRTDTAFHFQALCACDEWRVVNSQLFAHKLFLKAAAEHELHLARVASIRKEQGSKASCLRSFKHTSFGRLAVRHHTLKSIVDRAARGCALDMLANETGTRSDMQKSVCREMRIGVKASNPNKLLCRIRKRCAMVAQAAVSSSSSASSSLSSTQLPINAKCRFLLEDPRKRVLRRLISRRRRTVARTSPPTRGDTDISVSTQGRHVTVNVKAAPCGQPEVSVTADIDMQRSPPCGVA